MEPLKLKPRSPVEDEVIESWDDDDFMIDGEGLTLRSTSTATGPSRRRDSTSSHVSVRSELESWNGEVEENVHIPGDDEKSTRDAINAAQQAGIPLPANISSSALMGGTIKRLSGRKIRKMIDDDWENDLELPDASQGLKIKQQNDGQFPETLRQVSAGSVQVSPQNPVKIAITATGTVNTESAQSSTSALSAAMNLDKFKDEDEDDVFGDGCDTIRVSKTRPPQQPISMITPPTPQKKENINEPEENHEDGLELPSDGRLRLSSKKDIPRTPASNVDELDWGEGSLGTRFGGTRRGGRSNRSSSISAISPSLSSSFTVESEDETFEGLVLPEGPVNFQERLQKRRTSRSPARADDESEPPLKKIASAESERGDFMEGLELGDGEVLGSKKLTLHRNIKVKETQPASPARPKTSVSLTFSNKPAASTRIPKLSHERAHSTSLEPVSETGGPIQQQTRRSQSRLGHGVQASVSSMPSPPSARTRLGESSHKRELAAKPTFSSLREPTTTSSQLLKQKRSLPGIKPVDSPPRPLSFRPDRPPSRSGTAARLPSSLRPKTPVDRQRAPVTESPAAQARRTHLPFLPAGASSSQSHHVASKSLRQFRRHDSDNSIESRTSSRTLSRTGLRSPSPHRYKVAADTWERLSRPRGKKSFGDGHELDGFDDLPTSKEAETRYLKQPAATAAKGVTRGKVSPSINADRMSTPVPSTIQSPPRPTQTPRFARDTAASRIARETSLAQRVPSGSGPLGPLASQRASQLSTRNDAALQTQLPQPMIRSRKQAKRPAQLKPHLISNLNGGKESRSVNGMFYNPDTYRWEGNENALNAFEQPLQTPTNTVPPHLSREREAATPRPALITNISATKGVQVVGGMVFDPQNMCWLKIGTPLPSGSQTSDTMDGLDVFADDEDVFKDIPDLDDNTGGDEETGSRRVSDMKDDWLVGEEFDVGPEFIRRQREEEERWRKKCEKWVGRGVRDRETWRWTIRELVSQFELPM